MRASMRLRLGDDSVGVTAKSKFVVPGMSSGSAFDIGDGVLTRATLKSFLGVCRLVACFVGEGVDPNVNDSSLASALLKLGDCDIA